MVRVDHFTGPEPLATRPPTSFVIAAIPELHRYAVRLTGGDRARSEDLVQEACVAYVRRTALDASAELDMGWMIVVLRRRYLDGLRRDQRETERVQRAGLERGAIQIEPDWSAVEAGPALVALAALEDAQRVALILRYVDDMPVSAVAATLGKSVPATESLLARGRRRLAQEINDGGHSG